MPVIANPLVGVSAAQREVDHLTIDLDDTTFEAEAAVLPEKVCQEGKDAINFTVLLGFTSQITMCLSAFIGSCDAKQGCSVRCDEYINWFTAPLRMCDKKLKNLPSRYLCCWKKLLTGQAVCLWNVFFSWVILPYHLLKTTLFPCILVYLTRMLQYIFCCRCNEGSKALCSRKFRFTDRYFPPSPASLGHVGGDFAATSEKTSRHVEWVSCAEIKLGKIVKGARVIGRSGEHKGKTGTVMMMMPGTREHGKREDWVKVQFDRKHSAKQIISQEPKAGGEEKMQTTKLSALHKLGNLLKGAVEVREGELIAERSFPTLFRGGIDPLDICQGALGDCWLLAALATFAEVDNGRALQKLFLTKEKDPRGKYTIRLFDGMQGKWRDITIDDKVPCKKRNDPENEDARPMFVAPPSPEMWIMLIEKAFAKMCGSYAALEGGSTTWALRALTGCSAKQFHHEREGSDQGIWKRWNLENAENKFGEGSLVRRIGRPRHVGVVVSKNDFAVHAAVTKRGCKRKGYVKKSPGQDARGAPREKGKAIVAWKGAQWHKNARVRSTFEHPKGSGKMRFGKVAEVPGVRESGKTDTKSGKKKNALMVKIQWDDFSVSDLERSTVNMVAEEEVDISKLKVEKGQKAKVKWHEFGCPESCEDKEEREKLKRSGASCSCNADVEELDVKYLESANKRGSLLRPGGEAFSHEEIFNAMRAHHIRGGLMSASGATAEGVRQGLHRRHAYSILDVIEDKSAKETVRLVQIRNPWGTGEWTGPWSDEAEEWGKAENSHLKGRYWSDVDDGAFWMSWEDYVRCWDWIGMVHRKVDCDSFAYTFDEEPRCPGPAFGCMQGCARFVCKCEGCVRLYLPLVSGGGDKTELKEGQCWKKITSPGYDVRSDCGYCPRFFGV
jgi:hypothetical protein